MAKQEEVKSKEIPEWFKLNSQVGLPVNGQIQLHKDKEAVRSYFINDVNRNTAFFTTLEEKMNYLVDEGYLKPHIVQQYSMSDIKKIYKKAHSFKHRFTSFMGALKFYRQYALKDWTGQSFLGRYEDIMVWVAMAYGEGDVNKALEHVEELMLGRVVPATPTMLNIYRHNAGQSTSCFILSIQDNMESIRRVKADGEALSALGGGVSFNLINLRESGAPIKGFEGRATSKVLIGKVLEDIATYANQGGSRNGAFALYTHVMHPDVQKVLSVKKENADEKIRMKTMSIGVVIPDIYYQLLEKGEMMYQFSVYDTERELGIPFSKVDFTKEYYNLVNNPNIKKFKVNTRDLENEMEKLAQESGYPFRLNIDIANRYSGLAGSIDASNIC